VIGPNAEGGMHMASDKADIIVAVAGGAGRHSCLMPSFGTTRAVTVKIGS
jgi:hypothetical protein